MSWAALHPRVMSLSESHWISLANMCSSGTSLNPLTAATAAVAVISANAPATARMTVLRPVPARRDTVFMENLPWLPVSFSLFSMKLIGTDCSPLDRSRDLLAITNRQKGFLVLVVHPAYTSILTCLVPVLEDPVTSGMRKGRHTAGPSTTEVVGCSVLSQWDRRP